MFGFLICSLWNLPLCVEPTQPRGQHESPVQTPKVLQCVLIDRFSKEAVRSPPPYFVITCCLRSQLRLGPLPGALCIHRDGTHSQNPFGANQLASSEVRIWLPALCACFVWAPKTVGRRFWNAVGIAESDVFQLQ